MSSPSRSARDGVLSRPLAVLCAGLSGAMIAVQTRINGTLGVQLDDGFVAALISFGTGLVILSACLVFSQHGRRGLRVVAGEIRGRNLPAWTALGGVLGAYFVLTQSLVGAVIGLALFSVALVAGQTVAGLILDRLGAGPSERVPITWTRVLGCVLAIAAVVWAVAGHLDTKIPGWMLVLPVIAGLGISAQQALNGRVHDVSTSALTASFLNFAAGTLALLVATGIRWLIVGLPDTLPANPWLYSGGLIGCVFIALASYLVSYTGVLVLGLATLAGQLIGSVLIDLFVPGGVSVQWTTVAGSCLALIAVTVAALGSQRRRADTESARRAE